MSMVERECLICGATVWKRKTDVKRGQGKYCSLSCAAIGTNKRQKGKKLVTKNCALCGKEFQRNPSKLKNSKSGLFFCCKDHKDQAQRLGGIPEIMPDHYGSTQTNHRDIAFRNLDPECKYCGYKEHWQILEVHHADGNHSNNALDNLEIVCPNCHTLLHRGLIDAG